MTSLKNEIFNIILKFNKPILFSEIQDEIINLYPNQDIRNIGIQIQTMLKILISDGIVKMDKFYISVNEPLYIIDYHRSKVFYKKLVQKNEAIIQKLNHEIHDFERIDKDLEIYKEFVNERDLRNTMNDIFLSPKQLTTILEEQEEQQIINDGFVLDGVMNKGNSGIGENGRICSNIRNSENESMFGITSHENIHQKNFNKLDEKIQVLMFKTIIRSKKNDVSFFKISMKDYMNNDKIQKACMAFCIDFKSKMNFMNDYIQVDFPSDIHIDLTHLDNYEEITREIEKDNVKVVQMDRGGVGPGYGRGGLENKGNIEIINGELPKLDIPEPPKYGSKFKTFLNIFKKTTDF